MWKIIQIILPYISIYIERVFVLFVFGRQTPHSSIRQTQSYIHHLYFVFAFIQHDGIRNAAVSNIASVGTHMADTHTDIYAHNMNGSCRYNATQTMVRGHLLCSFVNNSSRVLKTRSQHAMAIARTIRVSLWIEIIRRPPRPPALWSLINRLRQTWLYYLFLWRLDYCRRSTVSSEWEWISYLVVRGPGVMGARRRWKRKSSSVWGKATRAHSSVSLCDGASFSVFAGINQHHRNHHFNPRRRKFRRISIELSCGKHS